MPRWGQVNTSEPPYYGLHAASKVNKQPRDGDKNSSLQYDSHSTDLLGLDGEEQPTGSDGSGEDKGQPSGGRTTTSTSQGGDEEALRVAQFIRRHGPGDALRIAASVLYATVGVIETQTGRSDETKLIRTIAAEIHTVARHLLHQPQLQEEGESLHRGTKRLLVGEVAQWEQQVQQEELEVEETAMSLIETGGEATLRDEGQSSTPSSASSHRRRRALAEHHKDFIGEDTEGIDDESCLMRWGGTSLQALQVKTQPLQTTTHQKKLTEKGKMTMGQREGQGKWSWTRKRAPTWMKIYVNAWWLEHYMAGLQRQLTSHIRWLRTNRAHWGSLQRSLIHEFQVALNGGQSYNGCWGKLCSMPEDSRHQTTHALQTHTHRSIQKKHGVAAKDWWTKSRFTVTCWVACCGHIVGTMAHEDRVRSHLSRMEHSPFQTPERRVRPRTDDGPHGNSTAAASSLPGKNTGLNTTRGGRLPEGGDGPEAADNMAEPWITIRVHSLQRRWGKPRSPSST